LHIVESKLIADPQSHRLNDWYFRLPKQRKKLLLFNKRYWGNLARKKWLVDGDRNSRYFHQSVNTRKHSCTIFRIKDTSGIWLEDPPVIRQKFIQDFSNRFTSARGALAELNCKLTSPVVTAVENAALIKLVTEDEIHTAVFQIDPHKAPGSDGFGAFFIKTIGLSLKIYYVSPLKMFSNLENFLKK